MHSKIKGNIGELRVACKLASLGYSVFTELGDVSRTDLVVDVDETLLRIQVKYISRKGGCYAFSTAKSGPGYRYTYRRKDVDLFALFCVEDDCIAWVLASDLISKLDNRSSITLRSPAFPSKNNQKHRIRNLADYLDFDKIVAPIVNGAGIGLERD